MAQDSPFLQRSHVGKAGFDVLLALRDGGEDETGFVVDATAPRVSPEELGAGGKRGVGGVGVV